MQGVESQRINPIYSSNKCSELIPLKLTIVGDGIVGKSSMLITYTTTKFPSEFVPFTYHQMTYTVFDTFDKNIIVDCQEYELSLLDTVSPGYIDRLRPLTYPDMDCILLCYSVGSRSSFDNIARNWHPEIRHLRSPKTPLILIGTKSDLRQSQNNCVSPKEGEKMKKKIGASRYLECSALTNEGLEMVFTEAVRATIRRRKKKFFAFPFIPFRK